MLFYKLNVLETLKTKGYSTTFLQKKLGGATEHKLRKGEMVGINALNELCALLEKQPGEIIAWEPDADMDD